MAEEVEKHVETIFSIRDLASKPLQVIGAGAQKLSEKVNKASEMLGDIAGVAGVVGGVLGFKSAIEGAEEYVGTIKKIGDVTGLAAEKADGLVTFFSKAGVSAEETSHAILMMSKAGVRMEASAMGVNASMLGTSGLMRQMGVDINKGPEAGLMKMAKLAQAGRLNTAQLMLMFRVAPETAVKMIRALKQGPQAMKETIDELKKRGIGVTSEDVASYSKMLDAQNAMKESWERIKVVVGKELFPILSELLKDGSEKLESWIGYAKKFGKVMSSFLHDHLAIIMRISKLLILNSILVKSTDKGMFEWLKKGAGMFSRAAGGKEGIGAAFRNAREEGGYAAKLFKMSGGYKDAGGEAFTVVNKVVGAFLGLKPLLMLIGRITIVGAVIGVIVEAFMVIKNNVEGVRDVIANTWENIVSYFKVMEAFLAPLFSLFSSNGIVGNFFQHVMVKAIELLAEMVEGMMRATIANMFLMKRLMNSPVKVLSNLQTEIGASYKVAGDLMMYEKEKRAKARADAAAQGAVTPDKRVAPYYDFRGSRFDITQKFAEGYDPDRLAVAFTNDLAAMGEARLQSNFSSPFSVR